MKKLENLLKPTAAAARPQLKELFDIVDSVKGIGQVIAIEILITTAQADPKRI